jgi:hypothetical protein
MPQILAAIGATLAAVGDAITAASVTIASTVGETVVAATGSAAIGAAVANTIVAIGAGVASLTGSAGIMAALSSWSTVATLSAAFMRPSQVGRGAAGAQSDFQADPKAGIPLMLGRSATAGKILHANTSGQANKNVALYYLIALSGGPLAGFEKLVASDWPVTFNAGGLATAPPQYNQAMYLVLTPGAKPDPQAYYPGGVQLPWIPEWTDAHRLSGVACAWWTLVYNTKAYPTGMPKPLFVIRGPAVYDPRADSTYPGGSGPQRWNDETTWSFTGNDNPFLQALSWCIGRSDNGKQTFGIGAPIDAIDVPAFVEGANVCEANGWRVGGEVLSSDRKWDVLTTILQAGGGEPTKLGGLISAYVRTPRVSLGTLVGTDIVGGASITGTKRRRDRINQIIPSYRSEDHAWTVVPAGAVTVNEYIPADGGLRSREGNYPLVQDAKQVAQLATYDILDAREFEPVVLPVGPKWQGVKPGDCVTITEPEFGMSGQQVIVQTRELDLTSGKVTLTCRSETPGKHDYALGRSPNPPPIPGLQPQDPTYVARPDNGTWTATGGVLTGADGAQVPAIWVTGAVNDPNVTGVIVEYQLQLSPGVFGEWVSAEFPSTTRRMEFRAVISGGTYHVQVRYRSVRNVEGALALDLGLVTVGALISQGVMQIGGQTPQDLVDQLNETTDLGQQTSDQAAQNAADILELQTGGVPSSDHRVDLIGFLRPGGATFQLSDTTLFANNSQSWGDYKQSLQTNFDTNSAAITNEATVRASGDATNATNITNVNTKADANTASITTLQTSVNGLNAQWVLSVSSQGPGYARVAGIKVASNPTVSSIAFVADQIGFTDGTSNVYPLAVVGGKVIATNFQADDIKANTITANMIIGGAITSTVVTQGGQQVNSASGAVEDLRFAYTSIGGMHSIQVYGELGTTTNAPAGTVFHLYRDTTEVGSGAIYCPPSWGGTGLSFPVADQPGPGTYTYVLQHIGTSGSGASRINRTEVILTELKR